MNLDVEGLKKRISGQIVLPSDALYTSIISLDNGRIRHHPKAIVVARDSSDIIAILEFLEDRSVPLSIKSGGHSYAGYCLNTGGLVIDLCEFNAIEFDGQTGNLKVGAGARWRDVYDYLDSVSPSLTAVGGTCLSVGVAGFLLGGGYSFLSRSFGLGSDQVKSLDVITMTGEQLTISEESPIAEHRELFQSVLGSGGGNFCIVLSFIIEVKELKQEKILGGSMVFPLSRFAEVMEIYGEWIKEVPKELSVYGYLGYLPIDAHSSPEPALRLQSVFNGSYNHGLQLLSPLLSLDPSSKEFFDVSFHDYLRICDNNTHIAGRSSYTRSRCLDLDFFTTGEENLLRDAILKAPSEQSFILWMHQGGECKIQDKGCLFSRGSEFILEIVSVWEGAEQDQQNLAWAYNVAENLSKKHALSYINYIDPFLLDWQEAYYGEDYSRLLAVKERWDPKGLLSFNQGIGSTYQPMKLPFK